MAGGGFGQPECNRASCPNRIRGRTAPPETGHEGHSVPEEGRGLDDS